MNKKNKYNLHPIKTSFASTIYYRKVRNKLKLVFSKNQLTQIKEIGIPQLKLLAIMLGMRWLKSISSSYQNPSEKKYL